MTASPFYLCNWCGEYTPGISRCEICDTPREGKVELGRRVMEDGNIDGTRTYRVRRADGTIMRFRDRRRGIPLFYRDDAIAITKGRGRVVSTKYGVAEPGYIADMTGAPVDVPSSFNGIVEETVYFGGGQGRRVRYTHDSARITNLDRRPKGPHDVDEGGFEMVYNRRSVR